MNLRTYQCQLNSLWHIKRNYLTWLELKGWAFKVLILRSDCRLTDPNWHWRIGDLPCGSDPAASSNRTTSQLSSMYILSYFDVQSNAIVQWKPSLQCKICQCRAKYDTILWEKNNTLQNSTSETDVAQYNMQGNVVQNTNMRRVVNYGWGMGPALLPLVAVEQWIS